MSAGEMLAYAIINFGLSNQEAGRLTLKKWRRLEEVFNQKKKIEHNEIGSMFRLQTWYLLNIHLDEKSKVKSPEDLWLLADEQPKEVELPTEEEKEEIVKRIGKTIVVGRE